MNSGYLVRVTFPAQPQGVPNMDCDILLEWVYYPTLTGFTTPLTIPTILSATRVKYVNEELLIDEESPQIHANNVFIRISITSTIIKPYVLETIPFTILPRCYPQPEGKSDVLSEWANQCQNNGVCGVDGKCFCAKGFYGDRCDIDEKITPKNPCEVCVAENLEKCNKSMEFSEKMSPCQCKGGFGGLKCEDSKKCLDLSKKDCGYEQSRGQYDTKPNGTCKNYCSCERNWRGKDCSSCSLECKNNGKLFRQCDRCGCPAGFTGQLCQCRGATLQVVLNGSHPILESTEGKLSGTAFDPTHEGDIALKALLNDFNLYFANFFSTSNSGIKHISTAAEPVDGHTRFTLRISYACNLNNDVPDGFALLQSDTTLAVVVQPTTVDELATTWDQVSQNVANDFGTKLVYVDNNTPSILSSDVKESEATLPNNSEELVNRSYVMSSSIMLVISAIVMTSF